MMGDINLSMLETEKLIAFFVGEELEQRKKAGEYKGSFAPVTHFFGYQGRAAHPSFFDCCLGSTLGFAAGVALDNGVNCSAIAVKDLTKHPSEWRVGTVPVLSMLRSHPKVGYKRQQLVVPSQEVELTDLPYQVFKSQERHWRTDDKYCNPGPIQFHDVGFNGVSMTLQAVDKADSNITAEIKGLCNAIHN